MKEGVEKVIEKLEIMSAVIMKNRKFKNKAEERLTKLEQAQIQNVKKDQFHSELEKQEGRIFGYIREQLEKF